jgi:hypothetical protein
MTSDLLEIVPLTVQLKLLPHETTAQFRAELVKRASVLVMIGASNPVVAQSYGDNSSSFHVSAGGKGELREDSALRRAVRA